MKDINQNEVAHNRLELQRRTSHPYYIHNAMLLETKLPDDVFKDLKNADCGESEHHNLVGIVKDQFKLDINKCPKFNKFLLKMANEFLFMRQQGGFINQLIKSFVSKQAFSITPEEHFKLKVHGLWLNSMEKGDYQPLHVHSGLFSFVTYISIPYTLEDESKLNGHLQNHKNQNGCTEFVDPFTHDSLVMNVEKQIEQTIVIFPSWITHLVYPYRSEGRRVTVSGNIYIDKLL